MGSLDVSYQLVRCSHSLSHERETRMRLPPAPKKPDPLERLLAQAAYQDVPLALVPHARAAPLGVLVRGTLEWLLDDPILEALLQDHAPEQYTRELTLSALVKLLVQVSSGARAS